MSSRFEAIKGYGRDEQRLIESSTVMIVGLGATGSVIAENLARHGAKLEIVDRDYLESKDTYSSSLYTPKDCEKSLPKAKAAKEKLSKFTKVKKHVRDFENVKPSDVDIIMDGTDNLTTRYQIHKKAQKQEIPWIYTAAIAKKGYSLFIPQEFCFKCFMNQKTKSVGSCETEGIMRETAQIVGSESSKKAIQYLSGKTPDKELFFYPQCEKIETEQQKEECDCDYTNMSESQTTSVCGKNKYQINREKTNLDLEKAKSIIQTKQTNEYLIRGLYNEKEIVLFKNGRAIIEAEDRGHAKSIYNKVTA